MSDGRIYGPIAGTVQFEPKRDRVVNGQQVTDIAIKSVRDDQLINITLWPEFQAIANVVKKGDAIIADGEKTVRVFQKQDGSTGQSLQLNATAISLIPAVVKAPRQVVQQPVAQAVAAPVAVAQPVAVAAPVAAPVAQPVAQPVAAPVAAPTTAGAPF